MQIRSDARVLGVPAAGPPRRLLFTLNTDAWGFCVLGLTAAPLVKVYSYFNHQSISSQ